MPIGLKSLIRGLGVHRGRGYHPFTQPPYTGGYPLGSRGFNLAANSSFPYMAVRHLNPLLRTPTHYLSVYEDRRLWHPLGANAFPKSLTQAYPFYIDKQAILPNDPDPGPFFPPLRPRRSPSPFAPPLIINPNPRTKTKSYYDLPLATWSRPFDMIICLKRKMRREVIHATRAILGSRFQPSARHMTQWSKVRCS